MNARWKDKMDSMTCPSSYTEQNWIDLLEGRVHTAVARDMHGHRPCCGACQSRYNVWSELLAEEELAVRGEGLTAAESITAEAADIPMRLKSEVKKIVRRRNLIRRSLYAAAPVAAFLILILMLWGNAQPPSASVVEAYVRNEEPGAMRVVQASDTSKFKVAAAGMKAESGYLWLSGDSREAFLLLDHISELGETDYQAWAITGNRSDSLGLVKLSGRRGHLYITADLRTAEVLAISAEPKGGSHQPTSRQMVLLLLR